MTQDPDTKGLDFAADAVKQVITLSSGILTVSVVFGSDNGFSGWAAFWLAASWSLFLLSTVFGVWTLLALTGQFGRREAPSPWAKSVAVPAGLQMLLFACGAVFLFLFGLAEV
jgi:hypothetical protein